MRLYQRNPGMERPRRPEICVEHKAPLPWTVEVGLGVLLVAELGIVVMLLQLTLDGMVKVDERVKSMHYHEMER
jgi:hypothetical protein